MPILTSPRYTVIEKTAAEMAGAFYEIGRSGGATSKHKTARAYAKANYLKFIPNAVEILIGMLGRQDIAELCKAEIYEALLERANDPTMKQLIVENNFKHFEWANGKNPFLKAN